MDQGCSTKEVSTQGVSVGVFYSWRLDFKPLKRVELET